MASIHQTCVDKAFRKMTILDMDDIGQYGPYGSIWTIWTDMDQYLSYGLIWIDLDDMDQYAVTYFFTLYYVSFDLFWETPSISSSVGTLIFLSSTQKCTFLKDSGVLNPYIFCNLVIRACRAIVETSHVLCSSFSPKRVSCHFKHSTIQPNRMLAQCTYGNHNGNGKGTLYTMSTRNGY